MIFARTTSADETKAVAASLAELARPGDLLLLAGDLGAGKTAFTQGFGAALGIDEQITSPTFTLVQQLRGPPRAEPPRRVPPRALAEVARPRRRRSCSTTVASP